MPSFFLSKELEAHAGAVESEEWTGFHGGEVFQPETADGFPSSFGHVRRFGAFKTAQEDTDGRPVRLIAGLSRAGHSGEASCQPLSSVRGCKFWAVDEGILSANPLARLRMPRARKRKRPILSWADEQKLCAHASPHLARIILAALDTGVWRRYGADREI